MDKQKLVRIILKDLEELKTLSEEIAEAENDAALIVDLALSKARLVTQEIDLLHEYTERVKDTKTEIQHETEKVAEDEDSVMNDSEPDMEILKFDVPEEKEAVAEPEVTEEELPEPETEEEEEEEEEPEPEIEAPEEELQEEPQTEEPEIEEEKEEIADENNLQEKTKEDVEPEELEESQEVEEENIVYDEDLDEEEPEETEKDIEVESEEEAEIEVNKLENDTQPEVREIHIDELDDDEADDFKFEPADTAPDRPVFHEIPKPESASKEKQVVGERFRKEPSLNDSMGEKKPFESKLTNGPISNLRASIGLNDRFLFIREIFDNNAEKYNTIIEHLDKLETIQQAVEYLKANLTLEKNDTSMKFVDLLKRRFTK